MSRFTQSAFCGIQVLKNPCSAIWSQQSGFHRIWVPRNPGSAIQVQQGASQAHTPSRRQTHKSRHTRGRQATTRQTPRKQQANKAWMRTCESLQSGWHYMGSSRCQEPRQPAAKKADYHPPGSPSKHQAAQKNIQAWAHQQLSFRETPSTLDQKCAPATTQTPEIGRMQSDEAPTLLNPITAEPGLLSPDC